MKNIYKVAGLKFEMNSFGRTEAQAEAYRTASEEKPDFELVSQWESVKNNYSYCSDDLGEYMLTAAVFYKQLLDYEGFMLHSSAVVADNKAYLFSADSGTGKSTHTELWLKLFGDKAYILNDDKPALRLIDGIWYAFGTPWSGKCPTSVNKQVPLGGIAMIERAEENEIYPFYGPEAIRQVLAQVNRPKAAEYRIKLLELLDKLFNTVPIYKLKCNMDISAAILSYETMSGKKYKEN